MKIYPTILARTKKELEEQILRLKWARKVQLDIMDGKFVKYKTYSIKETEKKLVGKKVQVHLMVERPELYIKNLLWAEEIIYHVETGKDRIEKIQTKKIKAGICFNPETKIKDYEELIKKADVAQIMTVHPGKMGGKYLKHPLKKIAQIKKINPKIIVGVDGGVCEKNIKDIRKAGADYAGVGSTIQKAKNPKQEYKKLRKSLQ